MNVPNHERKAFKDMTPEERSAIVEAWLLKNAEYYSTAGEWEYEFGYELAYDAIYRTRPRQLVIPWQHIKPEYKWAAMDMDCEIYFFKQKPRMDADQWLPTDADAMQSCLLNIDTTGIDWRESLVQRPE